MSGRDDARGLSEGVAVLVSGVVGIVVAVASVWYVSGPFDSSTETLYRINPTESDPAVGTDFVAGNTAPLYDALITVIHAVDVIAGAFILVLVFLHWGAFRRLGARMQEPGDSPDHVATDGGQQTGPTDGVDGADNGGERT